MHRFLVIGLGLAAMLWLAGADTRTTGQTAEPEVTLKVVKYDGLAETIRKLRGKVVVVDFWHTL